ncbi:hypothetical protein M427DRAFT_54059 [Gonapodya prolifera JEL478]|uniref:Uncharacterized protein n=1 Tax=Gonapodya prolifera (strain JEL478) TaxID=1344416 RepID=A0A139AP26_GONPJ|nr:hypothetical protein M427DRAFT_54059 [Gonapodya prolifera JEL478]|eukprot:KXS18245.1 hypothetical protein M427DRAFT_54059 [Gonapodya prolifera JEL478]
MGSNLDGEEHPGNRGHGANNVVSSLDPQQADFASGGESENVVQPPVVEWFPLEEDDGYERGSGEDDEDEMVVGSPLTPMGGGEEWLADDSDAEGDPARAYGYWLSPPRPLKPSHEDGTAIPLLELGETSGWNVPGNLGSPTRSGRWTVAAEDDHKEPPLNGDSISDVQLSKAGRPLRRTRLTTTPGGEVEDPTKNQDEKPTGDSLGGTERTDDEPASSARPPSKSNQRKQNASVGASPSTGDKKKKRPRAAMSHLASNGTLDDSASVLSDGSLDPTVKPSRKRAKGTTDSVPAGNAKSGNGATSAIVVLPGVVGGGAAAMLKAGMLDGGDGGDDDDLDIVGGDGMDDFR